MLYMPVNSTYIFLVLPALLFSMWAQYMVKSSFKKYSRQRTSRGITGADAARQVLSGAGVTNVRIERIAGNLTDHFDPRDNVIRLSGAVCDVPSVAAVGVAAHEAGHALQYARGYAPMKLRAAIIPVTSLGSKLSVPLVLLGIFLNLTGLINIGILLFVTVVLFQLVTLPVEFNASRRAVNILGDSGMLDPAELPGAKKVLTAAAMTYVAALATSLAQLLQLISIARRKEDR